MECIPVKQIEFLILDMAKPLGMHISAIRKFLDDHPQVRSENLTTSQCNRQIVKSESEGTGKPYINKYVGLKDKKGKPLVAPATVFISHAWRYPFAITVADCMEQHVDKEPDAYYWFDLFTNDQNAMASRDFDWFCNTFRGSINAIGQVLLVMYPWNDPMPVKRAWCLFEIANSIADKEVNFIINLPRSEVERMSSAVLEDNDCLIQALTDIQAEKADATSKDDLRMIFEVIEKSDGGFPHVNEEVKKSLRSWYVSQLRSLVKQKPNDKALVLTTAHIAHDFGYVDEAMTYAQTGLKLAENPKVDDAYRLCIYGTVASIFLSKGDLQKSLEYHSKSMSIKMRVFGENHASVASSYHNIANVYMVAGDTVQSLKFYEKSLQIKKSTIGPKHADVAGSYNNIALLYSKQGKLDKALDNFEKALEIQKETVGEKHPLTAATLTNMADIYGSQGKVDKALEYLNKSVDIKLQTLGKNHPSLAASYTNMANIHAKQGNTDKALEAYNTSLAINLATYGENHSNMADLYNNMANAYFVKRDVDTALQYFNKALKIKEAAHGPNHPLLANMYNNIATVYKAKGDLSKATECLKKAQKIAGASPGKGNDPAMAATYNNQANVHMKEGKFDQALELYKKCLVIQRATFGEKHPAVADVQYNIAGAYFRKGDFDNALETFNKCLPLYLSIHGPNHKDVASCHNNMSAVYSAKGESGKAKEHYDKAEAIRGKK